MHLGVIIRHYRDEHGLSLEDFSVKSGISKSYVGFLEKGTHPSSGEVIHPSIGMINKAANAMNMPFDELFNMLDEKVVIDSAEVGLVELQNTKVPVLGRVAAGIPTDAIEDVIGYETISESLASHGQFFGLKIKGNSMEPRIYNDDTVIVLKSSVAESGDIVVAQINDSDAVCKKLVVTDKKTVLHSLNPDYKDIDITNDSSFRILGVVTELRASLKNL